MDAPSLRFARVPSVFLKRLKYAALFLGSFAVLAASPLHSSRYISLELGDGVKMEFVQIPLGHGKGQKSKTEIGDFTKEHPSEPVRSAELYGPFTSWSGGFCFYLGKTEVTEEQWAAVT